MTKEQALRVRAGTKVLVNGSRPGIVTAVTDYVGLGPDFPTPTFRVKDARTGADLGGFPYPSVRVSPAVPPAGSPRRGASKA